MRCVRIQFLARTLTLKEPFHHVKARSSRTGCCSLSHEQIPALSSIRQRSGELFLNMGRQVCNLLTSHSEQTSDEWMLKLACLNNKHCFITKASFEAYIRWRVLDCTRSFLIIKHYFQSRNSTFAVGRENTADDTRTSLQISSPAALFARWLSLCCERTSGTTHTHATILSPLTLSAPPPPLAPPRPFRTNALAPTQSKRRERACVRTDVTPTDRRSLDRHLDDFALQSKFFSHV